MSLEPERTPKRSANIFINYRREDSAGHAGRLFDRLSSHFPGRVFMDIDTIEPGVDFVEVIENAVGSCEVLIVVIGREWLRLKDAAGRRRLDDPQDFVRLEVAMALERDIRVVPVLVEDAPMPRTEDLPPDLAKLARRNAIELSDARWTFDADRLIQTIESVLRDKAPSALLPAAPAPSQPATVRETMRLRPWMALAALVALIAAGWIGWRLMRQPAPAAPQKVEEVASAGPPPVASPVVPEPQPAPAASPEQQPTPDPQPQPPDYGPDTCKQGFVWREARPEDHVCVTPDIREQTAQDNAQADARRDPAGGPYGPDTCLQGYVWRDAYEGDHICVTPETREQARLDNSKAGERKMKSMVRWTKSLLKVHGRSG